MVKKNLGGRPSKVTPEVVIKLTTAFAMGFTDQEACLYSDITKTALYNYIEKHPEFHNQKETLKHKPVIKAKMNLLKKINEEDVDVSKRRLERKAKDEFSTKQEFSGTVGSYTLTKEEQELLEKVVKMNQEEE